MGVAYLKYLKIQVLFNYSECYFVEYNVNFEVDIT